MRAGQQVRDYVFEQRIGEGGMGEVWRAVHLGLRRMVAVKVIREGPAGSTFRDRFVREAQAMARLDHPHIVPIREFFASGGTGFLVMGLIQGKSLESRGRLPLDLALRIASQVLDALNFAHQQGVIHRDVKPSNILLDEHNHAYITDFGIALVAGTQRITRLTRSGTAVGTPEYMSPEQITTPADIDHRTDVYSFGCVLYEMLTGQPPFGSRDLGTTEFELLQAHVTRTPLPLRKHNVDVDRHTESVVMRALAKDPDERFAGCGEMAQALFGQAAPTVAAGQQQGSQLLFSLQGRLNRSQYWKGVLAVAAYFLVSFLLIRAAAVMSGDSAVAYVLILGGFGLWLWVAIAAKRLHDRNRPAWWLLTCLLLLPALWVVVELGFLPGTVGANRYGPQP
jgi:serine/threonine-protein kinase